MVAEPVNAADVEPAHCRALDSGGPSGPCFHVQQSEQLTTLLLLIPLSVHILAWLLEGMMIGVGRHVCDGRRGLSARGTVPWDGALVR